MNIMHTLASLGLTTIVITTVILCVLAVTGNPLLAIIIGGVSGMITAAETN